MVTKNSIFILALQLSLLVGCSSQKLTGLETEYYRKLGPSFETLTFDDVTGTFTYHLTTDLCKDTVLRGDYEFYRSTLHFYTDSHNGSVAKVQERFDPDIKGAKFLVFVDDSLTDLPINIYINNSESGDQSNNGVLISEVFRVREFVVSSIVSAMDLKYRVKTRRSNVFQIYLQFDSSMPCDLLTCPQNLRFKDGRLYELDRKGRLLVEAPYFPK